jgi:hypothetical protein
MEEQEMKRSLDVSFEHDYDSNLYMLSKDPDANNWTVIVHCKDGRKNVSSIEKFVPYPGCAIHENESAWYVEYFGPEKIEIQRSGRDSVYIKHPDRTR